MSPGDGALCYASRWSVFPCQWRGEGRKRPLTEHGYLDASREPKVIDEWWRRWPEALIGVPTGRENGFVVLDIDVKDDRANGYDSLDELGHSILPVTWMVHTASGGLHVYFDPGEGDVRNTASKVGPGLDVRGDGGYVILPAPGSRYWWDPHWNPDTASLAPMPDWLIAEPEAPEADKTQHPIVRQPLSKYGEAALDDAVNRIISASDGQQRDTLNRETFAIAGLVAGGVIPSPLALEALQWAARQMVTCDPRRPWRPLDLDKIVNAAFLDGLRSPRQPAGRQ